MFHLSFLVWVMILYKKYLWYISSEDVFEKIKIWLGWSASRQLGSAGAFRPDHLFASSPSNAVAEPEGGSGSLSPVLNSQWKLNNKVYMRHETKLFHLTGYLRKMRLNQQSEPPPLYTFYYLVKKYRPGNVHRILIQNEPMFTLN